MRRRKTVDADLIMSLKPCPEWTEERVRAAVPKRISVIDALRDENIQIDDRIWVILHNEFLSDRDMRLFACDCAERDLNREKAVGVCIAERDLNREKAVGVCIDERSWNAIDVSRRYANGQATDEELTAAKKNAWSDSRSSAAWYATWKDASEAALSAAWYAARSAARYAARYAALSAASEAALYAASKAARSAAFVAERLWQLDRIIEMIEEEK